MGADGEPVQDQLGADNGKRIGLERAVQRRQHHDSAWLHQRGYTFEEGWHVGHVLDHFEKQDGIEAAAACGELLSGELLGGGGPIGDLEPRPVGVRLGCFDVLGRGVNAGDEGAEPRQGLGDQPAAAADIEDGQA